MPSGAGRRGGGRHRKIRRRRRHRRPVEPYQQGRQRPQGVLSRVRDSVKNIVPQWLQRYFSWNEDVCSCSVDRREAPQQPENREDEHVINADEESTNMHDGRITPEPTVSNTQDPSGLTASNCLHVVMSPVHQSHLNLSMLESPALPCQSSTSSAFPADSSGFSKEMKDSASQHDGDNISTISDFSSRASAKAASKNTSVPLLQSTETEHCHSLSQDTATSSRKQAFNVSVSGTLFSSSSQLGDSHFHPVKTRYGGAAAVVRQPKVRNTPNQAPVRRGMEAQQLNAQSRVVTSSTARKILQCLEKMSSPLSDAKKIPCVVSSLNSAGNEKNTTGQNREQESMSSANGLTSGEGSGGGKMRRERMRFVATKPPQKKASVRRQIKIQQLSIQSRGGVTSLRAQRTLQSLESLSCPLLDAITTLYTISSPLKSPLDRDEIDTTTDSGAKRQKVGVTFSEPVAETAELSESIHISEPITNGSAQDITAVKSPSCKQQLGEDCESPLRPAIALKEGSVLDVLKNPGFSSPKTDSLAAQPSTTGPVVYTTPAISSFPSSGMEPSGSLKARLSWQRDPYLLVSKDTDNKCITCHSTKLPPSNTAKQTGIGTPSKSGRPTLCASGTVFEDKCKPAVGTWDCDTCLVQNKPEAKRCVACETPKYGIGCKRVLTLPVASKSAVTMAASSSGCAVTNGASGFGDKLKRPVESWQCPLCCNYNNGEDKKCVTCMCEKPGSSFVFGTGPSAPSVNLAFGVNQTAAFGQNQGASWLNAPGFGSLSSSAVLFSIGCRSAPPALGTMSTSSQPSAFGQ